VVGPLPKFSDIGQHAAPPTPDTADMSSGPSEATEDSIATSVLMLKPPAVHTTIRKSAYALPAASLTFKDLSFSLPARRGQPPTVILEPCSGHLEAGELVALMGPSGCGKTTLLDMLAMKKTAKYSGEVLVNGRPRCRLFPRIAAYVGQEDMMPAHWTVREAIRFNATLKRQPRRAHEGVNEWIDILVQTFALNSVADTLIGSPEVRGISGGQRRRVTLARGVAAHASLLFCDEPTSGLSATDAELCVKALRTVAKRLGVMCLVVIHQPRHEVAQLFDTLMLLTSSPGRMAYCGRMSDAHTYWRERGHEVPCNVNPTDFYLDLVTPGTSLDKSDSLVKAFGELLRPAIDDRVREAFEQVGPSVREMLEADHHAPVSLGRYAVSYRAQLVALLTRKLQITLRNPVALALPLVIPMIQGLIVGYMFKGVGEQALLRQVTFIFCLITMLCLAGMMSLITLITERTLMKYESAEALYSEGMSSLAIVLVDVPLSLLGALGNIMIMASLAGLQGDIFEYVLAWALLLFFVYDSLFAFIGSVAKDVRQAQVIAVPFVSIFMLFNGFIVTKADAPPTLHWLFDLSPNYYAMQAIVARLAQQATAADKILLEQFGYETSSSLRGAFVMSGMVVLLRLGQQLGLRYLNGVQR